MSGSCEETRKLLSGHLDGELAPEETARVQEHLASCVACRDVLASYAAIDGAVGEEELHRSEEEWERLASRIDAAVAEEPPPGAADRPLPAAERAGWWSTLRESLTPRRLAYGSAGTIVAALLVVLFLPLTEERKLAESDPPRVPSAKPPAPLPTAHEGTKRLGTSSVEESEQLRALGYPAGDAPEKPALSPTEAIEDEVFEEDTLSDYPVKEDVVQEKEETVPSEPSPPKKAMSSEARDKDKRDVPILFGQEEPVPVDRARAGRKDIGWTDVRLSDDKRDETLHAGALSPPGRGSIDEVRAWYLANSAVELQAARDETALLRDALSLARQRLAEGDGAVARQGLTALSADFAGNVARPEAWSELLDLEAKIVEARDEIGEIHRVALSADAFVATYPVHPDLQAVRDGRVRLWIQLARLDPERFCSIARLRHAEWTAARGPAPVPASNLAATRHLELACPE